MKINWFKKEKWKGLYEQLRSYFGRFSKQKKEKKGTLKVVNKKTINLAVLSGLIFILFVGLFGGIRAMTLSSQVMGLSKKVVQAEKDKSTSAASAGTDSVDNTLQYYLNDFVYYYFNVPENADDQTKQAENLNRFYGTEVSIQSQGQTKNPSELLWSRLLRVDENKKIATYQVKYKQEEKDNKEEILTEFHIPYAETKTGYYVEGLPWFTSFESSQASDVSESDQVKLEKSDRVSDGTKKKLDKFLEVFFTNYTTSQDNLDLVSKNIKVVENTSFKSIDYTFYKETKKKVMAYVQVTFEVAGTTHSENFTLGLVEKGKSYTVDTLEHTIPVDYAE